VQNIYFGYDINNTDTHGVNYFSAESMFEHCKRHINIAALFDKAKQDVKYIIMMNPKQAALIILGRSASHFSKMSK
jgi:hypothetical protein